MPNWQKLLLGVASLALACVPAWGQGTPVPSPIPVPGGDILPPFGLSNEFSPGVGVGLDGLNAEPNTVTNFKGQVAMGFTLGSATDSNGNKFAVITDIRVFQGDYIGGVATFPGGGSTSAKGHLTYLLI